MENDKTYLVFTNNQFYFSNNDKSKLIDTNIEKSETITNEKNLLEFHSKNIPKEFHDKYCLLFGNRIIFSSSDKNEALKQYKDYSKNNVIVTFYSPNGSIQEY